MQPDLLQQIFTRTTEAMLLVDPVRDSFVASNPAAQQLLGFEGDELAHLSPSTLFRTELGKTGNTYPGGIRQGTLLE